MNGEPILDLSFFHPGLIYFADSPMYPYFLADEVFSSSTSAQLEYLIKSVSIDQKKPKRFLISSSKIVNIVEASFPCSPLSHWPANQLLKSALLTSSLNPDVRPVSIYHRQVEDLTMKSPFIYMLEVCH